MANTNALASETFLSGFPLAMAYIPWQTFSDSYEPAKALMVGTIFPELDKPFTGKRRNG